MVRDLLTIRTIFQKLGKIKADTLSQRKIRVDFRVALVQESATRKFDNQRKLLSNRKIKHIILLQKP